MSHMQKSSQRRVRKMTREDIPLALAEAEIRLREHFPYFDGPSMLRACIANIDEPNVLLIRTDHAFGCASLHQDMMDPRLWVREEWVFGEVWGVVSCLREMIAWRDRVGAFRFTFGSLTPHNFAGIAKYLGLTSITEAYNFDAEDAS
jgi:hypothetical protein